MPGRRGEELTEEKGKEISQVCLLPSLTPASRCKAAVGMEGGVQHGAGPVTGTTRADAASDGEGERETKGWERKRRQHKTL